MTGEVDYTPQVSVTPRCPECGSLDCPARRSKSVILSYQGEDHYAKKQFRKCNGCGGNFGTMKINEPVKAPGTRKRQGWVSQA